MSNRYLDAFPLLSLTTGDSVVRGKTLMEKLHRGSRLRPIRNEIYPDNGNLYGSIFINIRALCSKYCSSVIFDEFNFILPFDFSPVHRYFNYSCRCVYVCVCVYFNYNYFWTRFDWKLRYGANIILDIFFLYLYRQNFYKDLDLYFLEIIFPL